MKKKREIWLRNFWRIKRERNFKGRDILENGMKTNQLRFGFDIYLK